MDAAELRATQAPIKDRYKSDPKAAVITLKAKGSIENEGIACKVETGRGLAVAGLHPISNGADAVTGHSGITAGRCCIPRGLSNVASVAIPLRVRILSLTYSIN